MPKSPPTEMAPQVRTQADLARLLGVSQVTIHKALAGHPGVGAETRRRIQRTADRVGYRLNASARAARRGSFGCLALLLHTEIARSALPRQLLSGIESAVSAGDRHLIVSTFNDEQFTSEGFVPKILRECMADGLLINYNAKIAQPVVDLIQRYRVPAVWLNSRQARDCVYIDDLAGARAATERLLEAGHRRVLYIDYSTSRTEPPWHYSGPDRLAGYTEAMTHNGRDPWVMGDPAVWRNGGALAELEQVFRRPDPPDAVLAYTPHEARAAIFAAIAAGRRVPDDLSVASFLGDQTEEFGRRLAGVRLPEFELGQQAVALLNRKLVQPHQTLEPVLVEPFWVRGDTVRRQDARPPAS